VSIRIRSEGCDDEGKTSGTCGLAYIYVNGKDHSPHNRGHNVVIVDGETGKEQLSIAEFVCLIATNIQSLTTCIYASSSKWV